ncbi:MAG TPA: hypothetical protein VG406_13200 [Isosphaeraceae bacterium]|jgi:hypothetical protein|nr:hypothetical protein [Isosphaeraceae bacterium]
MKCYEVVLDETTVIPDDWPQQTSGKLFEKWATTTGHRPEAGYGTWACEIATGCRTCREHLSLPCSLLAEANEIGAFLSSTCFCEEPATYLRLYLIILSEFGSQLDQAAKLMSLGLGKKPRLVALWANRWAKHRLQILLQHHPLMAFADQYGDEWPEAERRFHSEPLYDACGNSQPVRIIDTHWLEHVHGGSMNPDANGPGRAIVLVPPLMGFLDEVIEYFRSFVDACLRDPGKIRRFESSSYLRGC